MPTLRRGVLLLLMLTVPFQAALGATGMLCAPGAHHAQYGASTPHSHDGAPSGEHHHDANAEGAHHDAAAEPSTHNSHGTARKCKVCGESCSSAAAIPASALTVFPSDSPLRVFPTVDPNLVSRSDDGLFRPPRTTAV